MSFDSETLRKSAAYPAPKYRDPNDRRMVQIIRPSRSAQPRAVNIVGIPYDGAVLGRKGAAGGPAAVREAMAGFSNYNAELGIGLSRARVFDLGDVVVGRGGVAEVHRSIEEEVGESLREDALLILVGGDNSISLPSIRACSAKFGAMGLIVVDSHLDLRGKIGGNPTSGSSYGLAIETVKSLGPSRVVELGSHGFLNSEVYVRKAKKLGITLVTAGEVRRHGTPKIAEEATSIASRDAEMVYLSVDLDAVDVSAVSGVSAPSAGGIGSSELTDLVYRLVKNTKVKCMDLVELAPSLDPTGKSSRVAAAALMSAVAGFHARS